MYEKKNKHMYLIQTTNVYSQRNYKPVTNDPQRLLYLASKRTRCLKKPIQIWGAYLTKQYLKSSDIRHPWNFDAQGLITE